MTENTQPQNKYELRNTFVKEYCRIKRWDLDNLTPAQIVQLRNQPGWMEPSENAIKAIQAGEQVGKWVGITLVEIVFVATLYGLYGLLLPPLFGLPELTIIQVAGLYVMVRIMLHK